MCDTIEIETYYDKQYFFFPVSSNTVRFKVKGVDAAYIALTKGARVDDVMTEIHIGRWENMKSLIKRDRRDPDKVVVPTPNILKAREYVGIWITWYNNCIAAGLEGSNTPFIYFNDPSPHEIDHVGVGTGPNYGTSNSWIIEASPVFLPTINPKPLSGGSVYWVTMNADEPVPNDAVIGGFEGQERVYIARAMHGEFLISGKYLPSDRCAVVPDEHEIHKKDQFEILCGYNYMWVKTIRDMIPPHAILATPRYELGEDGLYIGRAYIGSDLIPGKVHRARRTCCVPYENTERHIDSYEILVDPNNMPKGIIWNQP